VAAPLLRLGLAIPAYNLLTAGECEWTTYSELVV